MYHHILPGFDYTVEDPLVAMTDDFSGIIDSMDTMKTGFDMDVLDLTHINHKNDDGNSSIGSSPRSVDATTQTKRSRKRMRTYTARKNEIEELMKELPQLENYVEFLKNKVTAANEKNNSIQKKALVNSCLRDNMHEQQYLFAKMHSAMSYYTSDQSAMVPIDSFIHLDTNQQKRMQMLQKIKPQLLRDAKRYMIERSWGLDLSVSCMDQSSYIIREGDYCDAKFCVLPMDGVTSVKQVFDAALFCIENMAIVISDRTGDMTIRVNNELDNGDIMQHCLVRTLPSGLQVEYNQVTFSHYEEHDIECGDGSALGLIVFGNIDKDDLYPYHPKERLRQDASAVCVIKTYKRKFLNAKKKEEERWEVVILRSSFSKLHRTATTMDDFAFDATCNRLTHLGDTLYDALVEVLAKQTNL